MKSMRSPPALVSSTGVDEGRADREEDMTLSVTALPLPSASDWRQRCVATLGR